MGFWKRNALWAAPVLFILLLAPISTDLDLLVAQATFQHEWLHIENEPYGFFSTPFFDFVYLWGVLPAQLICAASIFTLILSYWKSSLKKYRPIALMLSLTFCIGSGLITNSILKECWGRPRPRQIEEFGGNQTYRPFYQPVFSESPEPSKSFPSGHATCGFYFYSFYILGRRFSSPNVARFGLVTGTVLGGIISLARIAQGGHFTSDILMAACIMWLTAYFVDYLLFKAPSFANFRKKFYA